MYSPRPSLRPLQAGTARFELKTLLIIALMAGLGWAFMTIAEEVVEGSTHVMDESILLSMRSAEDLSDPVGPAGWRRWAATSPRSAVSRCSRC